MTNVDATNIEAAIADAISGTQRVIPGGNGQTLAEAMEAIKGTVEVKYHGAAADIRTIADEFRAKATYLDGLAEQVEKRAEQVKAEITSAVDFHQRAAESALFLRDIVKKIGLKVVTS